MNNKTIYIAIPTLDDNQTVGTVLEAISHADYPDRVYVGVAFMSSSRFYKKVSAELSDINNVVQGRFFGKKHKGVGPGRLNALSLYSNQDYVLQVDSHTKFDKGWDTVLINMYEQALAETKNPKTVITSYLQPYAQLDGFERERLSMDDTGAFPVLRSIPVDSVPPPFWSDISIKNPKWPADKRTSAPFVPTSKFNAQFAFSTREFVTTPGLPRWVRFWEEEVVQTLNLLDLGFSLVHPNQYVPLAHLYKDHVVYFDKDDISNRTYYYKGLLGKILNTHPDKRTFAAKRSVKLIKSNYRRYMADPANADKIKHYLEYAKFDLTTHTLLEEWYIPTDYNR